MENLKDIEKDKSQTKMNLNKLIKEKWNIEHFDGCPAFTEMTGSGFTYHSPGSKIPVYKINICYYKNREGDWLSLASDHKRIGGTIIKKFIKDKSILGDIHKEWLKNFETMIVFYHRSYRENLKSLSNQELWKWSDNIYKFYRNRIPMPGFIDGYMFYADKRFDILIKEYCRKHSIRNYSKIYSVLSAPAAPSFINEEERDLRQIVKMMLKEGFGKRKSLKKFLKNSKNKKFLDLLNGHLFKYSWIKSSYLGYKKYLMSTVEGEIKKMLEEQIEDIQIFHKHKLEKDKLIKKYKFTPEILAITKITEKLVKWQDQRKIYSLTFVTLQEKILREISKRVKIDLELLRYCQIKDLNAILKGEFNKEELKKRQKSSLFIYKNGKIVKIFTGAKAKHFFKEVSKVDIKDTREIRGMAASLGRVKGAVKIVKSVKYINKVKEGDILVAPMTRPEHLPGMKKAGAIITDDGGITCHAAIVSRELKIPCLIGTKIATKVLRDGDMVEVDAEKGVVKILDTK